MSHDRSRTPRLAIDGGRPGPRRRCCPTGASRSTRTTSPPSSTCCAPTGSRPARRSPRSRRRSPRPSARGTRVAFSSGTAALHARGLRRRPRAGDEVITTPLTFCATANAVALPGRDAGVRRRRCADTLTLDPADAARRITPRTRAILPVDYAGHPAAISTHLHDARRRHGLIVIEDACHSLGARYRGRRGRFDRPPDGLQLSSGQAHHHRRGRHGHDRRCRTCASGCGCSATTASTRDATRAAGRRRVVLRDDGARIQLPADRHRLRARPVAVAATRRRTSSAVGRSRVGIREAFDDIAGLRCPSVAARCRTCLASVSGSRRPSANWIGSVSFARCARKAWASTCTTFPSISIRTTGTASAIAAASFRGRARG